MAVPLATEDGRDGDEAIGAGDVTNAAVQEQPVTVPRRRGLSDRLLLLLATLAFGLLCSVPYAVAAAAAPRGSTFSGVVLNSFDQNWYLSVQRSAAQDLPSKNRFTTEAGAPGPVAPLYPVVGALQRATGLPAAAAYHLPRILVVMAFPALLVWFFGLCFPDRRDLVVWSVGICLFVTGFAAIGRWFPWAARSSDVVPESNALYSLAVFPHFAVAYAGMVLAFGAMAMVVRHRGGGRVGIVAAVAGLLLGISHTYLLLPVVIVLAIIGLAAVVRAIKGGGVAPVTIRLAAAAAMLVVAAPFAVSLASEMARLEELRGRGYTTARADAWWTWVLGYGVATPLAAIGGWRLVRCRKDPVIELLILWIVVQGVLVFAPFTPFQRRFSEGLVIPLAAVAAVGLARIRKSAVTYPAARAVVVGLLAIGSVSASAKLGFSGQHVEARYTRLWRHIDVTDVVLAGDRVSGMLPAFTPGTVYVGRPAETIRSFAKMAARARYAQDAAAAGARQWLWDTGITVVVVDKSDPTFSPEGLDAPAACLQPAATERSLSVYRVTPHCL